MAIVSIGDLLDCVGAFEERLEKYYAAVRDKSQDNNVRLLTYHLSRHRGHLQRALNEFNSDEIERIRKTKLNPDVEFHPEEAFHVLKTAPRDVKGQKILKAASGYYAELADVYKKALQQSVNTDAEAFVQGLICMEEWDISILKKMTAMDCFSKKKSKEG